MKKFSRILFLSLIICVVAMSVVACNNIKLKTPTNITLNGDTVSWDENPKAEKFGVVINDAEAVFTESSSFVIEVDEIGEYNVQVYAVGDGKKYLDSKLSDAVVYKKGKKLNAPNNLLVEEKILKWDAVPNAVSYTITLKIASEEKTYTSTTNSFSLDTSDFNAPAVYNFSVSAVGDGTSYYNSDISRSYGYVVTTKLGTPQEFKVAQVSGNVGLKWTPVENATKYRFEITGISGEATGKTIEPLTISSGSTSQTNLTSSSSSANWKERLAYAGEYEIKMYAFVESSVVYLDSDKTEGVRVKKLAAPTNVAFNGTNINWTAEADLTYNIQFSAKNKSHNETTEVGIETFDVAGFEKLHTADYAGWFYTMGIVAKGDGESVLDSEKNFVEHDLAGKKVQTKYLSYDKGFDVTEGVYEVKDRGDLAKIYIISQQNNAFMNVKLMNDIDFKNEEFVSIPVFQGVFDGNGFRLMNLNLINEQNVAAFGFIGELKDGSTGTDKSVIKNLSIIGITYSNSGNDSAIYVGGLVGINRSTIDGCAVYGASIASVGKLGGIAGVNYGEIVNCSSNITEIRDGDTVGGLAGLNASTGVIENSASYGNVYGVLTGVSGNSLNNVYVGGFVGLNQGTINDSFAHGKAYGNLAKNNAELCVGGFVGKNESSINNAYASGDTIVSASGTSSVGYNGGFVGLNVGNIATAYAIGRVNGGTAAGFAGKNTSTITAAFSSDGAVTGSKTARFVSINSGTIVNAFVNTQSNKTLSNVGEGSDAGITGKEISDMKQIASLLPEGKFVYNISVRESTPILANMFYLGKDDKILESASKSSNDYEPSYKTYFGTEKLIEMKIPASTTSGIYVRKYVKTVGEKEIVFIRYYKLG